MRSQSRASANVLQILLALLLVYIIWGSTYFAIRLGIATMPPFIMGALRFLIGGILLFAIALFRGDERPTAKQWRNAVLVGMLLFVGGNGTITWAEHYVPSGLTALLVSISPIWMTIIDWIRPGGKRPFFMVVAGLIIGFIGVAVLIGPVFAIQNAVQLTAMLLIPLSSLSWATGSIVARQASTPKSIIYGSGIEMLAAGAALLGISAITGEWQHFAYQQVSATSLLAVLYLVIFGSIVAFTAYIWLLGHTPLALASTYAYVNPIVAVFLGAFFAGEVISASTVIAAILIVGSVILITTFSSRTPSPSPEAQNEQIALDVVD